MINYEPTIASAAAGLLYAALGYARQQEVFDYKRFSVTVALSILIGSGMALGGIAPDNPLTAGTVSIAVGSLIKKGFQALWNRYYDHQDS